MTEIYIGTVYNLSATFQVKVPCAGTYTIAYEILNGWAYYSSYFNGWTTPLGYAGGGPGQRYYSGSDVVLTAGVHEVRIVGPEGRGDAKVFLVASSTRPA
ncbi:hypothetical protein Val02_85990 [Virgisporangium aliadipatigenens]|uniref:Uncharacterized protein n=1 Tax=Virgisporangium aliadipatigenens TaxID=741659 RepID=A0A8J3YY55_9ACTN|nr:hypothetical protein [Virgisporangium aliadipatigenens]GIJ51713.1 hypothetical protein Val02_85990 [Virgisporangium aliadipatigenens]